MFAKFELDCLQEFLIKTNLVNSDQITRKNDQIWIETGKEPFKFLIIGPTEDNKAGIVFSDGKLQSQVVFKASDKFDSKIASFVSGVFAMDRARLF